MSRDQKQDETPLTDKSQLIAYFQSGEKSRDNRKIGTEHEKFLFNRKSMKPLSFDEEHGIEWLLKQMAERYDWEPQFDEGRVVALEGPDGAVSLEPGGQFELSGAIRETVFDTKSEVERHFNQLRAIAAPHIAAVCWGMNPFEALDDVPWVPKSRYNVMKRYMGTRGSLAHWMMKMTCTIQANYDYVSEDDARELIRCAVFLSPIVNALFANSPYREGSSTGMQSFRAHIWTDTDNDRCGVPDFMYRDDWGYEDYAEWVLDVPMFFIRRNDRYIDMAGRSFRDFMNNGYEGHTAQMGDFELHLSTAFPEVRLKKFVEVRSADGGSPLYISALPALWKGILYDEKSRKKMLGLFSEVSPESHAKMFEEARARGLNGRTDIGSMRGVANLVLDAASEGLGRLAVEFQHPSEAIFLSPLYERLDHGTCAETFTRLYLKHQGDRAHLIRTYDVLT